MKNKETIAQLPEKRKLQQWMGEEAATQLDSRESRDVVEQSRWLNSWTRRTVSRGDAVVCNREWEKHCNNEEWERHCNRDRKEEKLLKVDFTFFRTIVFLAHVFQRKHSNKCGSWFALCHIYKIVVFNIFKQHL